MEMVRRHAYLEWSAKHLFEYLGVEAQDEFVDLPSSCSAGDGKVAIFALLERLFQAVDKTHYALGIEAILANFICVGTHGGECSLKTTKLMWRLRLSYLGDGKF